MRKALFIATVLAACAAGASAFELGYARPGGVYATLTDFDAQRCAQACADDGICLAWTLTPARACELKAVAPAATPQTGSISGLSSRAPAFARLVAAPAPQAPPLRAAFAPPAPARTSTPVPARVLEEQPDETGLLGGPLEISDLRAGPPRT